ncbi:MAG: DNA polymerase III subunit delta [Bacilli bacterium]
MTYTFVGNKDYIDEELVKIKKDFSLENIVIYNLEEDMPKRIIEDLNTVSLFGLKLVIVFNIEKLEDASCFVKYLDNQSDNTLVLISYKELDKRKKITKVLKEKTKYQELFNYDFSKFIKDNLDDYKMSNMAINVLISYCDNNLKRVSNELEKLKIYKINEKEITIDDVKNLIKKGYDSTIFNLIDAINLKDKDRIYKIYKELLEENETEEKILYTIANHYRLLLQIKIKSKDKSDNEIISEYKMHPYRLTKLKEQCGLVSYEMILKILKSLSEVDISFKSGKKSISTGMCLFFENL